MTDHPKTALIVGAGDRDPGLGVVQRAIALGVGGLTRGARDDLVVGPDDPVDRRDIFGSRLLRGRQVGNRQRRHGAHQSNTRHVHRSGLGYPIRQRSHRSRPRPYSIPSNVSAQSRVRF